MALNKYSLNDWKAEYYCNEIAFVIKISDYIYGVSDFRIPVAKWKISGTLILILLLSMNFLFFSSE